MVRRYLFVLGALLLIAGCTTSTVESRRNERLAAYQALPAGQKAMVDQGQIQVGMNKDAVYIAWGPPAETTSAGDQNGATETWLYYGSYLQETRYWNYREVRRGGIAYLERYYDPRDYVRAEITFSSGVVKSWRTLPRPPG